MKQRFSLAPLQRDALLRVVMAPTSKSAGASVDWSKAKLKDLDLDAQVLPEDADAWLSGKPTAERIETFASLFNLHDESGRSDQPLDSRAFLTLAQRHGQLIPALEGLAGQDRNARVVERVREFEEALVDELLQHDPSERTTPLVELLSKAGLHRYLRGLADQGEGVPNLGQLGDLARGAAGAPEAYGTVMVRVVTATRQRDADRLFLDLRGLSQETIAQLLTKALNKDAVFQRVASFAALSMEPAAASALAGMLGDSRRGQESARWLALMGEVGQQAARQALDAAAGETKQAREHLRRYADALLILPVAAGVAHAMQATSSAWNLDLQRFRLDPPGEAETSAATARPQVEPLDEDTLLALLTDGPLEAGTMPAHRWADLLQVVVLEPRLRQPAQALARARQLQRLGNSQDKGAMQRAIDAFDFDAAFAEVSIRPGLFDLLLGAEAPFVILLHALATFAAQPGSRSADALQRHFWDPLERFPHPEAAELRLLVRHIALTNPDGLDPKEMQRWPLLEVAGAEALEGGPWKHPQPLTAYRLRVQIRGAEQVRVGIHEGVVLVVDVPAKRWSIEGMDHLEHHEGPVFILGDMVQVDVERFAQGVRIGVGGVVVGNTPPDHYFAGLPPGPGTVWVDAAGQHKPELATLCLTRMDSQLGADAVHRLVGLGEVDLIPDVAAAESALAAHALAVLTVLGEDKAVAKRARTSLARMGPVAEPWRMALDISAV